MQAFMERPDETLSRLGVDPEAGLTAAQADESREKHGANTFTREKPKSFLRRVVEALAEPMTLILILAAVIALAVNLTRYFTGGHADFLECVGIFAAILLSVAITVIMEGRSAKAFEALSRMSDDVMVRVVRKGQSRLIPQREVVVGDILLVETGDKLPADARLLDSQSLTADESALTGESMPVKKDGGLIFDDEKTPVAERRNMLYSGCFITGGSGRAVVVAVGDATEFGQIAKELGGADKSATPLQEKMAGLGKKIALLGAGVAALVFIIQIVGFFLNGTAGLDTIADAFVTSIALIVAAVPEGLPTIMAVTLAIHIIKMSRQNALVKKLVACETVGGVSVICSDKTGTLTQNRMTVTGLYTADGPCAPDALADPHMLENICVNSTADLQTEEGRVSFVGNPTECALLAAAQKSGEDYAARRQAAAVAHVFAFSSETKNMTTLLHAPAGEGLLVYTKGSPEKILSMCVLPDDRRAEIEAAIRGYQEKACRVIGFAHKTQPAVADFEAERADIESGMTFDGFAAITDPLREDVYDAVARCRKAGIECKMLTGDNIVTASAIARELDLLDDDHIAVEAREIEDLPDEELAALLPKIRVIARSTPGIKMRVVNTLKALGNVVAVTGDGINDAPALKNADVGVAMGITGTEVSKQASDIVLLDDSFSTIVKAVQWGRGIYENFQRFIQFQLTVNLSSVLVVLLSVLCGMAAPFTALELLWVNIIMDGPPALTLGLEPVREDVMDRRPVRRDAGIVTGGMLARIAVNGVFIAGVCMAQYAFNFLGGAPGQDGTILFTLFVVFQLFNALSSRELSTASMFRTLLRNKPLLLALLCTFGLQVIITQFGGLFFGTVPLSFTMWLKIIALGLTVILLSEAVKLIQRLARRRKTSAAR